MEKRVMVTLVLPEDIDLSWVPDEVTLTRWLCTASLPLARAALRNS